MTSIARPSPTPRRPRVKVKTLEEQLSEIRSQTSTWDIGKDVAILEEKIKKNERMN